MALANFISDSFPVWNFGVTWAVPSRLTLGAGLRLLAHRCAPLGSGSGLLCLAPLRRPPRHLARPRPHCMAQACCFAPLALRCQGRQLQQAVPSGTSPSWTLH